VILLQSQPFGRRDSWAVVNHAAAASALRAVRTVLHQLIRLSESGSRPVKDLSRRSRGESASSGLGSVADRVTGVELPRQLYTACGECQTSIASGIFKIQGLPRRATSECVISTLAALGAPRTEAEAVHRLWCPADYLGGDRVGRAYAIPEVEGSSDAADENLRIRGFRYQSSRSHRYLSVELSPIHGQRMGITDPSAKLSNCFAARMFRASVGK